MVLVLFETAVGFCLFSLADGAKLSSPELHKHFESETEANRLLQLSAIHRFQSTVEAVEAATAINEGKLSKGLKRFLQEEVLEKGGSAGAKKHSAEKLIVSEPKLASTINKKLGIEVASESSLMDLYRGIRENLSSLLSASTTDEGALDPRDLSTMSLGLSHSLSRYKLKFSPEKVDIMVVQAIALLDDLDKELNIYAMRVKEWYGWHFPEMGKIITDNIAYARVIRAVGFRSNANATDLSEILPEELEQALKAAAEISMGTEVSDTDMEHIWSLCDQVIAISEYRAQLYTYLCNRMAAIAPNLTALVGELVGARLISHAGSLMNLAKQPASTIQILGAEKALFRALKTKHDTPKYGLLYHSSLVGQAPPKQKGKMARMVATKAALSIRLDALADEESKSDASAPTIGAESRARLEARARGLDQRATISSIRASRGGAGGYQQKPFTMEANGRAYNAGADAPPTTTEEEPAEQPKLSKEERKALKKSRKADREAKTDAATEGEDMVEDAEKQRKKEKAAKEKKEKKEKSKRSADELGEDDGEKKKKKKSKKSSE